MQLPSDSGVNSLHLWPCDICKWRKSRLFRLRSHCNISDTYPIYESNLGWRKMDLCRSDCHKNREWVFGPLLPAVWMKPYTHLRCKLEVQGSKDQLFHGVAKTRVHLWTKSTPLTPEFLAHSAIHIWSFVQNHKSSESLFTSPYIQVYLWSKHRTGLQND